MNINCFGKHGLIWRENIMESKRLMNNFTKKVITIISIVFILFLLLALSLYWFYYLGPLKLAYAASKGDVDSIKCIIRLGISPDQDAFLQGSPVNCAIANNKISAIRQLYSYGANLNNLDAYGIAPIHALVIYNQSSILKCLLEDDKKNIEINLLSRDKKTALDYAIEKENQEIIDLLKSKGAQTAPKLVIPGEHQVKGVDKD